MGYYMNSPLICATILAAVCFILESIALATDVQFTQKILDGIILTSGDKCQYFARGLSDSELADISFLRYDSRDVTLLRRDLAFEPLFVLLIITAIALSLLTIGITARFWLKKKHMRNVHIMNKLMTTAIMFLYIACSALMCISVILYDNKYKEYNNGKPLGCNVGYHHQHKLDSYCDRKYEICQNKTLKITVTIMMLICALLSISATTKEMVAKNSSQEPAALIEAKDTEEIENQIHASVQDIFITTPSDELKESYSIRT